VALLIDAAYELFGFRRRPWVDVAQQPIQRERMSPDQVGRIFDGLWWHTIHLAHYCNAAGADYRFSGSSTQGGVASINRPSSGSSSSILRFISHATLR
jgi:hypothetical protein